MISPKEKAIELVARFEKFNLRTAQRKESAMITVDEVLGYMGSDRGYSFWCSVKEEIKKL